MTPALLLAATLLLAPPEDLLTIAESSGYRATASHAQVVDLLERLAARSPRIALTEMGRTEEGKPIPLAIVADPPVSSPAEARASGKTVVFAFGDIHAGEVCGKEALLMLVRELALAEHAALLDDLVLLVAPIYNGDGNDRMAIDNRPGQVGPEAGMGQRPNASGLDLNRDWMKLESSEAQAMARLLTVWNPHVTVDTHTTNGSRHRYTLTYAAPLNPSGYAPSIAFVRDELLPEVSERLRTRTGYETFFYGNFNRAHTTWSTYSAQPRFGGPYRGLRGQMSILSEAYAYASYKDRVLCTLEFVREIAMFAAEHGPRIRALHQAARDDTTRKGRALRHDDLVGIRHRLAAHDEPAIIRGYALSEAEAGRRPGTTDVPHDHTVVHLGRFEPTVSVRRPLGYIIPQGISVVFEKLAQHGIRIEPFVGEAVVEAYTVTGIERARREFQGHRNVTLAVSSSVVTQTFEPGAMIVRTAQPLGTLAVYLLEPQSDDGLATWNFLDDRLRVGQFYPIYRVRDERDLAPPEKGVTPFSPLTEPGPEKGARKGGNPLFPLTGSQ